MQKSRPVEDGAHTGIPTTPTLASHESLAQRILEKMELRLKLGWVDYSSGSYDRRVANARASRIIQRRSGKRITLLALMWE